MPEFEHGLDFRSLDDAVTHAQQCLAVGYVQTGKWDLAQTCRHLTDWVRAPLDGSPPMPWMMRLPMEIVRLTLGTRILKQILGKRRLPIGMGTVGSTVHPPEPSATQRRPALQWFDRFKELLYEKLRSPVTFGLL